MRWSCGIGIALLAALCSACTRDAGDGARDADAARDARGSVTISGDDSIAASLTWRPPQVDIAPDGLAEARKRAEGALADGNLYADSGSAIPIYLAILAREPDDAAASAGLRRAVTRLIADGRAALAAADDDIAQLRRANVIAAVARHVRPGDDAVRDYLEAVDTADRLWELNRTAEQALRAGRYEGAGGALASLREALALRPGQPRAMQTLAAVESALVRRAEQAGDAGDFEQARRWLAAAAEVRDDSPTIADAYARLATVRLMRIARLRDEALALLPKYGGIEQARKRLAQMLAIAEPGNPAVAELHERIDLAVHYGMFRPGQRFTDALGGGARGPQMIVVPHGGFRMGAGDGDAGAEDNERPQRYLRFDRGFALSVREVTVGDFRRFIAATGHRTRAERRGFSMAYDERSGNFARRSRVDWRSGYDGRDAGEDDPVLHVSAKDAQAYAEWLSKESGRHYRLPSEAEFEYALRAGGDTTYPWGDAPDPPPETGNLTGAADRSPGGRNWANAFAGYGDGYWGPAPVASFAANAFGLHDLAGNVSEWVADCWHDGYRRAPKDGAAWLNPGCRTQVIRGGSWASAPTQTRSSWRAPASVDTTNARIGFRVARDL
jgi:formylglycine-generating enzyme required for sulfatase activity